MLPMIPRAAQTHSKIQKIERGALFTKPSPLPHLPLLPKEDVKLRG
jgi:hypothetical protein